MTTFADRLKLAEEWELALIEQLEECGWLADRFGQAQIRDDMRKYLRRWPTPLRWLPDILAIHPGNGRHCLIDAKTDQSKRTTDNYAVEVSVVDTGELFIRNLGTPVFYVWPDGGVMTPWIIRNRGHRRDGKGTKGSGTPFYLIDRSFALRSSDLFGMQLRGAA